MLALLPLVPAQYGQYGTYRDGAFAQQSGVVSVVAGDYDGDGCADIVTTVDSWADFPGALSVLSGAGLGEIARIECPEGLLGWGRSLATINDVSGDGCADVLIGNAPNSRSTGVTALCGRTGTILWEIPYPTPPAGLRAICGVATNLVCNTDAVPDCAVLMEFRGAGVHTIELLLLNGADGAEVARVAIPTYSLADGPHALSRLGEQLVLVGVAPDGASPVLVDLATRQLRALWQTSPLPPGSRAVGTCAAVFERAGQPWYFVGARGGHLRTPLPGDVTSVPVGYCGRLDGSAPAVTLSLPSSGH